MTAQLDRLEREVLTERESLNANLHELEHRVRSAVDWRTQVDRHPWTMVAVAIGCGVVLSAIVGGPRRRVKAAPTAGLPAGGPQVEDATDPVDVRWSRVKDALATAVTARAVGFLDGVLPGASGAGTHRDSANGAGAEVAGNGRRVTGK